MFVEAQKGSFRTEVTDEATKTGVFQTNASMGDFEDRP